MVHVPEQTLGSRPWGSWSFSSRQAQEGSVKVTSTDPVQSWSPPKTQLTSSSTSSSARTTTKLQEPQKAALSATCVIKKEGTVKEGKSTKRSETDGKANDVEERKELIGVQRPSKKTTTTESEGGDSPTQMGLLITILICVIVAFLVLMCFHISLASSIHRLRRDHDKLKGFLGFQQAQVNPLSSMPSLSSMSSLSPVSASPLMLNPLASPVMMNHPLGPYYSSVGVNQPLSSPLYGSNQM